MHSMSDDFEREREDYIARARQGSGALGSYYGRKHPASVPGRTHRSRTTRSDIARAAIFLVAVFGGAFLLVYLVARGGGATALLRIGAAAFPLSLVGCVVAVLVKRRRERAARARAEYDADLARPHGRTHHHHH
jgi:VIT1/CCC1 family predicted Fe2+/Mn2+ transporter